MDRGASSSSAQRSRGVLGRTGMKCGMESDDDFRFTGRGLIGKRGKECGGDAEGTKRKKESYFLM